MIHDPVRVDAIRKAISIGVKEASDAELRYKDERVRESIRKIGNEILEVDLIYLRTLEQERRNPATESEWLAKTEQTLKLRLDRLKKLLDDIERFGLGVKLVG